MTRTRTAGVLAAAVIVTGLLAGCSPARVGSAAVIEGRSVATEDLQRAARDHAAVVPAADAAETQVAILQRTIFSAVVDEVARENGVRVSAGRVAAERDGVLASVGGRKGLIRTLAQSQPPTVLAPTDIDRWVKDRLLFLGIAAELGGGDLAPDAPETQEAIARTNEALRSASRRMDIEVSPRYGRWHPDRGITAQLSGGLSRTAEELAQR